MSQDIGDTAMLEIWGVESPPSHHRCRCRGTSGGPGGRGLGCHGSGSTRSLTKAFPPRPPARVRSALSAVDRRALTEMLVDKIVIAPHPHKIDQDGRRHYLIRAIPYQDPQREAERLKAVHEARVKIVPRV
jgi:hypothetical protein